MFHKNPRWLGADAAYSIPLGGERVLWLFGDTYIATSDRYIRSESTMVRNSVALQEGLDPTKAKITFYWNTKNGKPASFFPERGGEYYWPLHGAMLQNGNLIIFTSRVRDTPGEGLGFAARGWALQIIDGRFTTKTPDEWRVDTVIPRNAPAGRAVGQSVVSEGSDLYVLSVVEPGNHEGAIVKYSQKDLEGGLADNYSWWNGGGWTENVSLQSREPAAVMADGGPECSLHFDATLQKYIHIMSLGFGSTELAASFATKITGPWSAPSPFFRAEECKRSGVLVYAGKAHPELDAGRDEEGRPFLAATYATNNLDFSQAVADLSIYYPRFVRIRPAELYKIADKR